MIKRGIKDYFTNSRKKKHIVHASNKSSTTLNSCISTAAVEQLEKQPEQTEKINPAVSETEREVVVSAADASISSTSKNSPKKRKKVEVIEIDEGLEKQFPITFFEFLEYTNVLDIVDAIARDARKHKSTQYTPDMVYAKKLARRLYVLFYTKIKYRKRKPLTDIKLSQNCPAYVNESIMNVPKKYDTERKRNSVANSNLESTKEAERRTSNDITGTSKSHNTKNVAELENLESLSISSGHSQQKTPTQTQILPPPPPFEDFRKVVIMDEEFENHLTSLCAGNLEKIEDYRNQPNVRDEFEFSFYKQFYSIPDNRRRLNWKLRPCPLKIREQILTQAALETTNESVEINRKKATYENPVQEEVQSESVINSRGKREHSNELKRSLLPQTKRRKKLASADASAPTDSSNQKVPSPTPTSSKITSAEKNNNHFKNSQGKRVLLINESLTASNENQSQSDCQNNESPNNCQEERVSLLTPPTTSNKTSPKPSKNNDGCQNNEGRILVIKTLPNNKIRPQRSENNNSKSHREKKVSVLLPTSKQKTRSRPGRNNDISESIQEERVSVLNEIDNFSNETSPDRNNDIFESIQEKRVSFLNERAKSSNKTKEYSKNKKEEIISIITDSSTSNNTSPTQLSTNNDNMKDNRQNIHLFYNDKFSKHYIRKKLTCNISEPEVNLNVKRLNEEGFDKIREGFCHKVGVAGEVAEGDELKTVVRIKGKSEESINELNDVLTTDEAFSANVNTKEGHLNTMPVKKNNSSTKAGKGEAVKATDKILIAEDALLKDKNVEKIYSNPKEISCEETSAKNAPLGRPLSSDVVFLENREEQSTTKPTKEVIQTRSAPEVLNTKVGQDKTSRSGSGQQDLCRIDRCTTMAYVARRSRGLKQRIVCTILKMSIDEFKKYTHIYERPRNIYEDLNILQKCYQTALVKQIWYPKLYMSCQHIFEYLSTKGIVLEDLSLEYISPKLVFYEELASITNFDEIVAFDYFYETAKKLDRDGDPELLKERRMLFYKRCWKHEKWIWRTPTFSESWKLITMKYLDNNITKLAPLPPNSIGTTTETGSDDNAEVQKETSDEVKEKQRNIEVVSIAVHNKELPRRDDNEETIVLPTQNNRFTSKQSSQLKSKRLTEKDRTQEQNLQEPPGNNEKEADQQKGCQEKITPANETERDEVVVSAAVKSISSTSKNSPKKRKKEVIEIDEDLEKQFPITFFEFLEHTNVLDIVDVIARDARKHKSTQYTPDMVYAKILARRLYVLFYTKIKYRKRKPLTDIKLSQNCPAYVKESIMNVPKKYDTERKRNSVANSNLELTQEAERRTSNDITGTSKSHNSKNVAELENLESLSISSGHSQKKKPTQTQTLPPPPPFEDFRKVVIMDEEFENHLTSLCAGNLEKIEAYRNQPNVRNEFEFSFYKQFYSIPNNRHRLNWKLRPCPLKIREQILTQAGLETTNESFEVYRKEATNENPVQEEVQYESVINSLINSCGLMTDAAVNKENCNFKYPISFEKFKACTYYKEITEEIFRNTTNNPKAFEEFKSNEALQNSLFRNYYEAFYKTPEIRSLFKIKIKPVPSNIKERILHVPSEVMDADALSTATKLEKKDKTSRMKREHSNELGKTLSPQTKRKTLASADVSAATDSSNQMVPSPTPTSSKKASPGKNNLSKNHRDERVLLVNESLKANNENRSQSDCQNNESPNNCQEERVLLLNAAPTCSNKTSPKPSKNNDGYQNNEEGRVLVLKSVSNSKLRLQRSENNNSKINQEKNVSVLLPTSKNKSRSRLGRNNDISEIIQEESVSVHNEIANSSKENKEYSKNKQEKIISIITDSLTSNKTTPTQLSRNKGNIKGNQENIHLFYNDKFLKKYIRKKVSCDINEPQVNLIVKRLNEEVFEKMREGFCHKVGVAGEVAAGGKRKTVVRLEGKSDESINELNDELTTDEAFSANENTKEGHLNTMPVKKNNSSTKAGKGEAVKATDKILIADDALLKDKNVEEIYPNPKEISCEETSAKNEPLGRPLTSDVVFLENREEQSTTKPTKEVIQTRSAPEVLNTKVGQDKTSRSGSGQQDLCRIDRCTTMAYVARRSRGLKQRIVCTILKMSIDEFKKYTHIYERPRNIYEDLNILQKCYQTALVKQIWYPKFYMSCQHIFEYLSTKGIILKDLSLEYISPKLVFYEELASITNFDEIVAFDYFYETAKKLDRDGDPELLKERRMVFYNRCWEQEKWIWRTPTFSESWKLITKKQLDSTNRSTTQLAPSPNSIGTTPGSISGNNAEVRKETSNEVNENQRNSEVVSIAVHRKELPRRDDNEKTVVLPTQNTASQQSSELKSKRITKKDTTQEQNIQQPPANNEEVPASKPMVLLTPTPTFPKPIQHDEQNITTHVRKKKSNSLNLQADLPNTDLQTQTYLGHHHLDVSSNSISNGAFVRPSTFGTLDSEKEHKITQADGKTPLPLSPNVFISSSGSTTSQPHHSQPPQATTCKSNSHRLSKSNQRTNDSNRMLNENTGDIANENPDDIASSIERTFESVDNEWFIVSSNSQTKSLKSGDEYILSSDPLAETLCEQQAEENPTYDSSSYDPLLVKYTRGQFVETRNCRKIVSAIVIEDTDSDIDDDALDSKFSAVSCKKEPEFLNKLSFTQTDSSSLFVVSPVESPPPIVIDDCNGQASASETATNLMDLLMNPTGIVTVPTLTYSGLSISNLTDPNESRICEAQRLPSSLEEIQKAPETTETTPSQELRISKNNSISRKSNISSKQPAEQHSEAVEEFLSSDENYVAKQTRSTSTSARTQGREKQKKNKSTATENRKKGSSKPNCQIRIKDSHLVPQITHRFQALPLVMISKPKTNFSTNPPATMVEFVSTPPDENNERGNSLPSTQASAVSDTAKSVGCSNNSIAKSFSASQHLATDCTFFENTQLLRELDELRTNSKNKQNDMPSNAPASALTASVSTASASTSTRMQVNEQAAPSNLSQETIFYRQLYQFHYFAALNEQQVAAYELPQLALGQQYMLAHIRMPSGQRIKVFGGDLLRLLFPTFSRNILCDVFYVLNDVKEYHYSSVSRRSTEVPVDLRERALNLLFQSAPIFCYCGIKFDSSLPDYGICVPVSSVHNESINRKPFLPLTAALKPSLLDKMAQLKSQLASQK